MGKNQIQVALQRVLIDISNIADIIEDSKKLNKSFKNVHFDNENETEKAIQDTKAIVTRLNGDVTKIGKYFDENCKVWQNKLNENCEVSKTAEVNAVEHTSLNETINPDMNINGDQDVSESVVEPNEVIMESDAADSVDTMDLQSTQETTKNNNCVNESINTKFQDRVDDTSNIDTCSVDKSNVDDTNNTVSEEPNTTSKNDEVNDITKAVEKDNLIGPMETSDIEKDSTNQHTNVNQTVEDEELNVVKKETKVFLKCIDIDKLKAVPPNTKDDSILIISDSEPEKEGNLMPKKSKQNGSVNLSSIHIGSEITVSKVQKPVKNDTSVGDNISKSNHKFNSSKEKLKSKKISVKDPLKIMHISSSSSSSCSDSDKPDSFMHKKIRKQILKIRKPNRKDRRAIDVQHDKKFSCIAYVLLTRYPCEKLKELYLKKKDLDDVRRLTDLSSLKKRKRDKSNKGSDTSSEKYKINKKRSKRRMSNNSNSSEPSNGESSDEVQKNKSPPNDVSADPPPIILSNSGSVTEASADEDTNNRKKKKSIKSDKKKVSHDDEDESSDSKNKRKWKNHKLLKSKLMDSDSKSEEEFEKFYKKDKFKRKIRSRLAKKNKSKKVIDSDSDSSSTSTKKKKKKAKSESSKSSSSSSSSSSESDSSDNHQNNKKPIKRSRIKRVKDSSSDENKSTRKTIRKVIAHESLQETTKQAEKEEKERKARIAEKQKKYNSIFDPEKLADSAVEKVVLDFDEKSKEELLSVDKSLVVKLKPHQAKGVQFMWDACFESIERAKNTNGSGCILAHCMGLGKTLQVITLVHTLITNYEKTQIEKIMVVCPVNTVLNWVDEFQKWLGELDESNIEVYELVSNKQNSYREYLVKRWIKHGGVLIIGYDMFRNLTNPSNKRIRKQTREIFHSGMVDPGPDLIVCDEGHLLKNEKTNLSVAISRVRTERRIVLTGTPMQNNMKEYYCMVQFVKPNLLGTYKEYINRFVNPITNGQYTDSTPHDISIMKKRSHVLHKMLDGIVQRRDYDVLAPYLPPKYEYVLFTKLSEIQIKLYQYYLDNLARRPSDSKLRKTAFLFSDFQEFQRICTHPRVLLIKSIENRKKAMFVESDEDSEGSLKDFIDNSSSSTSSSSSKDSSSDDESSNDETSKKKNKKGENGDAKKSNKRMTRTAAAAAGVVVSDIVDDVAEDKESKWWRDIVDGEELENIAIGGKLYLLFEILQQCEIIGDKILIFSQSLYSLNIIEYFLHKIDEATQDNKNETVCGFSGSWAAGLDYFRIDGSSSCDNRAHWCKSFNNPENHRARLFLISTKAGGLGINLIGANRVIIFDVSWNPSHDTQSIYRVYRFGQTKPCYIYRFVTYGTMEMKIYERQVTKQAISKRIIDEQQIDRHYNQNDLAELYRFDPYPEEAPTPLLPKDILLAELLQKEKARIYKYHEHQSLLENKEEEELDEAERKAAWEEYETEKTKPSINASTAGWIGNLPLVSINAALLSILQRDNPTWNREQVQAVIPVVVQQLREQLDNGQTVLYERILSELKVLKSQQQQKLQQYYMQQQQLRMMQQHMQAQVQNSTTGNMQTIGNILNNMLNVVPNPLVNSNEVVELND